MRPSLLSFIRLLGVRKGVKAWRAHSTMMDALRGPQTTHTAPGWRPAPGSKPSMPGYRMASRRSPWVERAERRELPAKVVRGS